MSKVGPYIMTDTLGVGAFGKVKRARHMQTGAEVAVKIMDKGDIAANDFSANVKREIFIMRTLSHRNIVNLREVLSSKTKLYLVMDLVRGGELFTMIEKQGELDERTARCFFQQLVDGLAYCHTKGVCHRDLKPENLLVDEHNVLKITDFGVSSMREAGTQSNEMLLQTSCGTPYYVAPEVLFASKRGGYDGEKADSWSVGVILFLLLSGELPFMNEDMNKLYEEIKTMKIRYPKEIKGDAKELLKKLLERDPIKRWSLEQVKTHKWFATDYARNIAELSKWDKPKSSSTASAASTATTTSAAATAAGAGGKMAQNMSTSSTSATGRSGNFQTPQAAVGAVEDEEDELDTAEDRKAIDMQRPVGLASVSTNSRKNRFKGLFKIKHSVSGAVAASGAAAATPTARDKVSRVSSFEEFKKMESSASSRQIQTSQSSRGENLVMARTGGGNSRENLSVGSPSMPRPKSSHRSSQISIEGADEVTEGARNLRKAYEGKDMRSFVSDALPGKPEKKIDEVVEKLSEVDVDCIADLQVMVDASGTAEKLQQWLMGKPALPEVTAKRITSMFFP